MSLAYKLWKIGNVLTKEDIEKSIRVDAGFKEGVEPNFLNIDFTFKNDSIQKVSLNRNAISMNKLFFTKKIGGTSNAYYLYPNIAIQKSKPLKGMKNIKNTLKYLTQYYCNNNRKRKIELILESLDKYCKDLKISEYNKGNYIIWLSINGITFYELMPEVWGNYYKNPFVDANTQTGFDIFTNEEAEIGYKTDFKVFSYDQYHDSLNYRLDDNLPMSKESARNIKYAWLYILDNLVFYYKGLEYVIIPNLLNDDNEILKMVLRRFVKANNKLSRKKTILDSLRQQEKKLKVEIKKLQKKKNDTVKTSSKLEKIKNEINKIDLGMITELNEQAQTLDEFINMVTLDYFFVNINRTNLSFEITGSIEDVIPSKISKVVEKMREYNIVDLVKLGTKESSKTYLQDYFNRNELECMATPGKSIYREKSKELKNNLISERIYLARLLLTNLQIKRSDLLHCFEFNRNFNYCKKKRMVEIPNDKKIMEWIQFPDSFVKDEDNIVNFLKSLKKIQED